MAESSTITREMIEAAAARLDVLDDNIPQSRTELIQNAKNKAADKARTLMYPARYTPVGIRANLYATTPTASVTADDTSKIDLDLFMERKSEFLGLQISHLRNGIATIQSRLPTCICSNGLRHAALATGGAHG